MDQSISFEMKNIEAEGVKCEELKVNITFKCEPKVAWKMMELFNKMFSKIIS